MNSAYFSENGILYTKDKSRMLAFPGAKKMDAFVISDSVTEIGLAAFCGCKGLTTIVLPKSVKKIEYNAFQGCTGLTTIDIPDSVTKIGAEAFSGCINLKEIHCQMKKCVIYDSILTDCNQAECILYVPAGMKMENERHIRPNFPEFVHIMVENRGEISGK